MFNMYVYLLLHANALRKHVHFKNKITVKIFKLKSVLHVFYLWSILESGALRGAQREN